VKGLLRVTFGGLINTVGIRYGGPLVVKGLGGIMAVTARVDVVCLRFALYPVIPCWYSAGRDINIALD